jgi:coproporphyrinogen III oxidase-like Fe-S oxidoreductase
VQEEHEVARSELGFEFMMNALRLTGGFPVALLQERTGLLLNEIAAPLAQAERLGLIARDHLHMAPTQLGQRFLNDLLQLFLTDDTHKTYLD